MSVDFLIAEFLGFNLFGKSAMSSPFLSQNGDFCVMVLMEILKLSEKQNIGLSTGNCYVLGCEQSLLATRSNL